MQLTKFTKTLNGITPSLAMVPDIVCPVVVHPAALPPSALHAFPFTLFRRRKVALITDGGKKLGKRWQDISSTLSVDGLGKSAMGAGDEGRRRGVSVIRGGSRKWERVGKGSVCAEEGCY